MGGSALPVPTLSAAEAGDSQAPPLPMIFERCCIYFDGRVDGEEGLSSYALGKLARLHGAHVTPRLTKKGTTHVVCRQLSGAKERKALVEAASGRSITIYFVLPAWITQSVTAQRRLNEGRFSLLARAAREAGETHLRVTTPKITLYQSPQMQDVAPPREPAPVVVEASAPDPAAGTPRPVVLVSDSQSLSEAAPPTEIDSDEDQCSPLEDKSPSQATRAHSRQRPS